MRINAWARVGMVGVGVALTAAVSAGVAIAVLPTDTVATYTGCLTAGGAIVNVALGNTPARDCGTGALVHLGGGDITAVLTPAGSGLTGGAENGEASLALDSAGCAAGGVLKFNGTDWACGSDDNTTYSAGTGLALTGSSFSVSPAFQLPQDCAFGQIAKLNTVTGSWVCANEAVTQFHVVEGEMVSFPPLAVANLVAFCPEGDSITGGGYEVFGQVRDLILWSSRPFNPEMGFDRTGWTVSTFNTNVTGSGDPLTARAFAICASS